MRMSIIVTGEAEQRWAYMTNGSVVMKIVIMTMTMMMRSNQELEEMNLK